MSTTTTISNKQTVAFGQFDDSMNFADVIYSVLKQNDLHLTLFCLLIVLFKFFFHHLFESWSFTVPNFLINIRSIFIKEIHKNRIFLFIIGAFFDIGQKYLLNLFCYYFLHFLSIVKVHQTVMEHSKTLVHPHPDKI